MKMNPFTEHLAQYSKELNLKFEGIRRKYSDSDVKGAENEKALRQFFAEHYPAWSVRLGCQVVNANNDMSDELDIVVCNEHQSFAGDEFSLLIAEGVDFVVQSKAILTSSEIKRAVKNCVGLKKIGRSFNKSDVAQVPDGVRPEEITRIPYIIFAFCSELNEKTVLSKLSEELKDTELDLQPDAVFILDRGMSYLNLRDGSAKFVQQDKENVSGWVLSDTGEHTLSELLRFVNTQIPKITRHSSPLKQYIPFDHGKIIANK